MILLLGWWNVALAASVCCGVSIISVTGVIYLFRIHMCRFGFFRVNALEVIESLWLGGSVVLSCRCIVALLLIHCCTSYAPFSITSIESGNWLGLSVETWSSWRILVERVERIVWRCVLLVVASSAGLRGVNGCLSKHWLIKWSCVERVRVCKSGCLKYIQQVF